MTKELPRKQGDTKFDTGCQMTPGAHGCPSPLAQPCNLLSTRRPSKRKCSFGVLFCIGTKSYAFPLRYLSAHPCFVTGSLNRSCGPGLHSCALIHPSMVHVKSDLCPCSSSSVSTIAASALLCCQRVAAELGDAQGAERAQRARDWRLVAPGRVLLGENLAGVRRRG